MQELLDTLAGWAAEGAGVGRAVVVRTFGSAPRPEGAVLLVTDDGRIAGSVSGGCVEGAAAEEIKAARAAGRERVIRYGISDEQAWDVGLACGGTIDVLISPRVPAVAVEAARETREGRGDGRAIVTVLPADAPPPAFGACAPGEGSAPVEPLVVHDDGRLDGSLGDPALDAALAAAATDALSHGISRTVELGGRQLFIEVYPVRPRLIVVGAVEVSRTLVRIAKELGYETVVIDGRAAFATEARFPDVDRLIVGWPDEIVDEIGMGPADAVAVLAHDVKFDEPAIVAALARGCRYVGAVGSRKTQADRRERLLAAGVSPDDLARLRGPIGLDLGGRLPAETALAIIAEIVAERRAGTGRPMRELAREHEAAIAAAGTSPMRVTGVVLAAGSGSRFGSAKQLALLDRRPLLQHPLDALAAAGLEDVVVVLGDDAPSIEAAITWRGERRRLNPRPQDGLASSLRIGLDAAAEDPAAEAVLIVLGDQPSLRPNVIRFVLEAASATDRPIVRVRWAGDGAPNPVLVRRAAWALAAGLEGDRGLGPLLAQRPDLVAEVPVSASLPDVDTPADLEALAVRGAGPAR